MKNQWLVLILVFSATLVGYISYSLIYRPVEPAVPRTDSTPASEALPPEPISPPPSSLITVLEETQPQEKGRGIAMGDLSHLAVADEIAIFIPQEDSEYSGYVSDIQITAAGNQTILGHLEHQGREYRFVFTVGPMQTFGTLHTPNGRYQLEVRDGIGTLISSATINEGLDFSKPDYVIPERETLEEIPEQRPE